MDCKKIQSLFSEYFDKDISAEIPLEEIEAHLATCDNCAAEFDKYAKLINEVRVLPEPELPQNLPQTLVSYVKRNRKKSVSFRWVMPVVASAASLIFALVWFVTTPEIATEGFIQPYPAIEGIGGRAFVEPIDGYVEIMPMDGYIDIMPIDIDILWDEPVEESPPDSPFIRNIWLLLAFIAAMCAISGFILGARLKRKSKKD